MNPPHVNQPTQSLEPETLPRGLPSRSEMPTANPVAPASPARLLPALLVAGWLVVLSLTVIGLTQYRGSSRSAELVPVLDNAEQYLHDIRDHLTQW